jgi:uncharacterized protein (TIGR00725 family)
MPSIVVGVMGPGETATVADCANAELLGQLIAQQGWVTLTGGRPVGVMEAALLGAKKSGGLTVGILPDNSAEDSSQAADIRIVTGMGEARNVVNVLTSQLVFVCGMSTGTASEVALALKTKRQTILVNAGPDAERFWTSLGGSMLYIASTPEQAIEIARRILQE